MPNSWDWNAIGDNWATQTGSATSQQKWKNSINALQQSPTALAATPEAEARYMDGIQRAVSSGKRRRRLTEVSLGDYQTICSAKAGNLAVGARARKQRYIAAMQPYSSVYQSIKSELASMPKGGEANALARSAVAIRKLMQAAGTA